VRTIFRAMNAEIEQRFPIMIHQYQRSRIRHYGRGDFSPIANGARIDREQRCGGNVHARQLAQGNGDEFRSYDASHRYPVKSIDAESRTVPR
jgi:hypothetical protein